MIRRFIAVVLFALLTPLSLVFTFSMMVFMGHWMLFVFALCTFYIGVQATRENMFYLSSYLFIWRVKREWLERMMKANNESFF